jgi:hypothetical protein
MEYLSQVYLLSTRFFRDYPAATYPELMHKLGRPYTCLLIDSHEGFFICVPFRSSINHKNAFFFKGTVLSQRTKSGLDYSKIVIISNPDYIDSSTAAVVDQDEYNEMMINLPQIVNEVVSYVDTYIAHINGTAPLHPRQFIRAYGYSTLVYFHDIMGIVVPQ